MSSGRVLMQVKTPVKQHSATAVNRATVVVGWQLYFGAELVQLYVSARRVDVALDPVDDDVG